MDLSQAKHAFITGGASGIGLGIADALSARNIAVTIADIDSESLAKTVASREGRLRGQRLDTRDRKAWLAAKETAEAALGPVDILVNNAGIAPNGREFADMDPESFDRIIAINLTGVFNGVSTFADGMRMRGHGHIVNTSSLAGLTYGFPGLGAYSAAKFGVVALTECLRLEMAPHGVGVSVLCPGLVATNLPQTTLKLGGEIRGAAGAMPAGGILAADVGEMVVRGIAQNMLYIITHENQWPAMEMRMNALRDAALAAPP
jgi:NAD(P)-dependent dehydrogenase (short-subunit alcohol dehydrogenase family)